MFWTIGLALILLVRLPGPFLAPGTFAGQPFEPDPVVIEVAGSPARGGFLARAVARSLGWIYGDGPVAIGLLRQPADLAPGHEARVEARVALNAGTGEAGFRSVPVTVRNVGASCHSATALFVSNSPETLRWSKGLFRGAITPGETVRLLYHHRNGAPAQRMVLTVRAANPSRHPARFWINDAVAGPAPDELFAGHAAAARWLPQYWSCTAQALEIPANSTRTLAAIILPPQYVASGILQVSVEQGDRVILDVQGRMEHELEPAQESYQINRDRVHVRGTFPSASREVTLVHHAGTVSLATIGADPVEETSSGVALRGNYGVIYQMRGRLINPDAEPRRVVLRVTAMGGFARATTLLNGSTIETPLLRPGEPHTLTVLTLGPQETRPLFLATMPQAGSAYPLRMTFSPP